jgi:DNA repair protein RadD
VSTLRDFQALAVQAIYSAWHAGLPNVLLVSPTGSGKTVIFSHVIDEYDVPTCAIAHRLELVSQTALTLNRENVPHGIIAPKPIIKQIIALEHDTHGHSCYNYRSPVRVGAVNTLNARDTTDRWFKDVQLVVIDEGHHVLRENIWGEAMASFPNARGLFVTAHALRADGKGLGRHADGLADTIVQGPTGRELINRGFLTDYRIVVPPTDIDFSDVPITATGDYSMPKLRAATHKSNRIVGDVVRHYMKFAPGKLGLTFAVDVEAASELAKAYRAAGVPAEVITAKTPIGLRGQLMRQFRRRELLQLVSVDTLGEGTDVPAIEVVSMARKTASLQLFSQQFGRSLRIMVSDDLNNHWGDMTDAERVAHIAASTKPRALILDHVGNTLFHGLPDIARQYTLNRRAARGRGESAGIPLRTCLECLQPFERVLTACPYCAAPVIPQGRGTPEAVEGDLIELDEAILQAMRGAIDKVDGACHPPVALDKNARMALLNNHNARATAQKALRATMALWGGWQKHLGRSERESQKRFWHQFGIDVMSAQALGATAAHELRIRIDLVLAQNSVVEAAA